MASNKRSALTDQEITQTVGTAPSDTLKRHPGVELNKRDLWRILSILEGELQAREITIATLKCDRAKQLFYQAKYGRFGLGDAFLALQRDSESQKNDDFDENGLKTMYDNQLGQLENLIATQRRGQQKMREQLHGMEKKYYKVLAELEEERRKHERDAAQGDDVLVMLEKERERLKSEVDYEKSQNRKIEKELKKVTTALEEELSISEKQKKVALLLIRERHSLAEQLTQERRKCALLERLMRDEKTRLKQLAESLMAESTKASKVEAALEKQMSDLDTEREALRLRLRREETRNAELQTEMERLRRASSQQPPSRPPPDPPVRRTPETPQSNLPSALPVSVPVSSPGQARRSSSGLPGGGPPRVKSTSAGAPGPPQQSAQQQPQPADHLEGPNPVNEEVSAEPPVNESTDDSKIRRRSGGFDPIFYAREEGLTQRQSLENGDTPEPTRYQINAVLRIEELLPQPDRGVSGLCRKRDILLGTLTVGNNSSWEEVEEHLILLFLTFIRQLDHGENSLRSVAPIGLSVRSIHKYNFGDVEWLLNHPPNAPFSSCLTVGNDSILIHLHDSSSGRLDSLALQMMFSVPSLQEYLDKLENTNILIFAGVKYSCKRYLVANFAALLQLKYDKDTTSTCQCIRAHYSGLENFSQWAIDSGILVPKFVEDPDFLDRVYIITVTNIAQIYDDPIFQILLGRLGNRQTEIEKSSFVLDGQIFSIPKCIYLLGSIDSHELSEVPRAVGQALQCLFLKVDEEPLSGLLTRRTRLVEAMPRIDPLFCRAVRWIEEMWLRLVSCLTRLGLIEAVIGPSVFVSCPLHSKSVDAVVKWFISVWNHAIVPVVRQAISRSSTPDSTPADRSGRVSDTAVYVLLQQAVVNGCPLPPLERDKLLGCLQGATALNPPWKRSRRVSVESSESRLPTMDVNSHPHHSDTKKPSRSLPMTPPTMPALLGPHLFSDTRQQSLGSSEPEPPRKLVTSANHPNVDAREDSKDSPKEAQSFPDDVFPTEGDTQMEEVTSDKTGAKVEPPCANPDLEGASTTVMEKLQGLRQVTQSHNETDERLAAGLQSLKALISQPTANATVQLEEEGIHKQQTAKFSRIPMLLQNNNRKQKKSSQSLQSTHV